MHTEKRSERTCPEPLKSINDNANMICELVEMKDCNNDDVLNKEECNAVISYPSTI